MNLTSESFPMKTSTEVEPQSMPFRWESIAAWAVVMVAVAHLGLALNAAWPFTTDDAYITLRYARHLAAGEGIRWNIGESPLEGYSNPFSLLLATIAIVLGGDPVFALKAIGVSTALVSPVLAFLLARQFVSPAMAAFAALPISLHFGTSYWAGSGLETPIYLAMSLGCLALWCSHQNRGLAMKGTAALGILAGIICLVRPDGILLVIAIAIAISLEAFQANRVDGRLIRTGQSLLGFGLGVLVIGGSYTAFRISYFGRILPNSALCKAMWNGDPLVLLREALPHGGPLALGTLVGLGIARRTAYLPLVIFPLLTAMSLIGVDPIIGDFQRHFVTAFGVLGAGAAVGFGVIINVTARRLGPKWVLGAQLSIVSAALLWLVVDGFSTRDELQKRARFYERRMEGRAALATWIRENTSEHDLVLLGDAGIIPYQTPNPYRDAFCLNEAALTSPPIAGSPDEYARYIFESQQPQLLIINENALNPPEKLHGTSIKLLRHPRREHDYTWLGRWSIDSGMSYLLFKRRD